MGPALNMAFQKTFIFAGRKIKINGAQRPSLSLFCSSQNSNFGQNQFAKLEILLSHKLDMLHFVSAKKPLLSLNIFCMYINTFLSASSMQGFVQVAAV